MLQRLFRIHFKTSCRLPEARRAFVQRSGAEGSPSYFVGGGIGANQPIHAILRLRPHARRREAQNDAITKKAFTLIELLLGLTIFAMIGAGLYSLFGGVLRLEKKLKGIHAHYQEVRLVFDIIGRDMENAIPYPFNKEHSDKLAFEGHKGRMIFFVPTDEGIEQVEYYLGSIDLGRISQVRVRRVKSVREIFERTEASFEGKYLIRRLSPLGDVLSGKEEGEPEALSVNLDPKGLRFRYGLFSDDKLGRREVTFRDDWKDNRLPDVVRVELAWGLPKVDGGGTTHYRDFYFMVKGPLL